MTVAVETMREAHKADYTAATQYITARMAQINSANVNAPGTNPRRVSEVSSTDLARNEFNGVDIRDPWRKFTDDEWFNKLGQRGQELVRAKRHSNAGRGGRGRGQGRGGRGRGGRRWYNSGRGGRHNNAPSNNTERTVNETSTNERTSTPAGGDNVPSSVSITSQTQASTGLGTNRGGQNGNRFGTNRS